MAGSLGHCLGMSDVKLGARSAHGKMRAFGRAGMAIPIRYRALSL